MTRRIFLDNPPESNIPTLNEYLAQRAAEEQEQYYLQGSRNREESYPLFRKLTKEELDGTIRSYKNDIARYTDYMLDAVYDYADRHKISPVLAAIEFQKPYSKQKFSDEVIDSRYNEFKERVNDTKKILDNISDKTGDYNCIATALSNNPNKGHFVTGNASFKANPGKYGFKRVEANKIKPGGIIQHLEYDRNPVHAVILDHIDNEGNRYVNYSPGNYPVYHRDVKDWENTEDELYYNFVGNSADSTRWTNEYNKKYRKLNGGLLNKRYSLKHGGIYIQPSHRGRFTALKERTGHSATWFKENGTLAQKKMATFALNAAKWNN